MPCLLISVRLHDGRYHGRPDWPPSPARLFQALVAGAAQGELLAEEDRRALAWLESLEAPVIAVPPVRVGQNFTNFVPNNDLDAAGGDPARVSEIRAPKLIRPILFDGQIPLLYLWTFGVAPEPRTNAEQVCGIANRLYQFGRGVDMAWAWGQVLTAEEADARLAAHGGALHRPSHGAGGVTLAVPLEGSLASLVERHKRMRARFQILYEPKPGGAESGRKVAASQVFVQPPKPSFRPTNYESPPARLLFDLVGEIDFWRPDRIVELTERARDLAADRLKRASPGKNELIERILIGRQSTEADKAARVRIMPLPSIGHQHADRAIRRILIELPPNCPLRMDDVVWAFSTVLLTSDDGEILCELVVTAERGMLAHYGIEDNGAPLWRTVTPAVLSQLAGRRRIDPRSRHANAKGGIERAKEEGRAVSATIQALRHAGIATSPLTVRVQREPFEAKGVRAEAFASGTRFAKERLWHVEIAFAEAAHGPLILGDGRYLGLGLMAPVNDTWRNVFSFSLPADIRVAVADRADFLRAVRRALMALSRDYNGNVSPVFSGHEPDGAPAHSGQHRHFFAAAADLDSDDFIESIIIAAPWTCDRSVHREVRAAAEFDRVTSSLETLRAGRLGIIPLTPSSTAIDDRLVGPARTWESHTEYHPTRHAGRGKDPCAALLRDVATECERRGLPKPSIDLLDLFSGPKGGITARLRLRFAVAVAGPILLGRDSHQGGGLFVAVQ